MRPFEWLEPMSASEAAQMLAQYEGSRPISGGTALVLLMKRGLIHPPALVSLRRVAGLREIRQENGFVFIGAMMSQDEVANSPIVRQAVPLLARAAGVVGNIRVRVASTLGGSLGEADYQSDLAPALVALGATVHLQGPQGIRQVQVADFFTGPYETCMERGELVTGVTVPVLRSGSRSLYQKFVVGPPTERPALSVAAVARFDEGGRFEFLKIVLGSASGLSSRPLDVLGLADVSVGQVPSEGLFDKAAELAYQQADPVSDLRGSAWYKKEVTRVLVKRVLKQLAELNLPA